MPELSLSRRACRPRILPERVTGASLFEALIARSPGAAACWREASRSSPSITGRDARSIANCVN